LIYIGYLQEILRVYEIEYQKMSEYKFPPSLYSTREEEIVSD
jgi:hypothetical protein